MIVAVLRDAIKRTLCIINLKYKATQNCLNYTRLLSYSYHQRCLNPWVRAMLKLAIHFQRDSVSDTDYTASSTRITDKLETNLEESGCVCFFFSAGNEENHEKLGTDNAPE